MNHAIERSAADWLLAAMDCYVVEHQGCPYCHERHCVFRSLWAKRIDFYCSTCEFAVCLDGQTGTCHATPGNKNAVVAFVLDEAN
jgi:hypothetical protein